MKRKWESSHFRANRRLLVKLSRKKSDPAGDVMAYRRRKFDCFPYAIAAPALIILLIGMMFPMIWSLVYSFTDKHVAADAAFVGFQNYEYIFNDPTYVNSVWNTVLFTVGSMVGKVFFGVIIALILNMNIKFRNFLRTLFLLPWTLPSVVAIYTWMFLYTGNGGLLNSILLDLGLVKEGIAWLSDPNMGMVSLMLVNIWRGIPFIAITVLSGLQTIPEELYESAQIDGASTIKTFTKVTLPLIMSVILVSTLISTIWTINDFETVYLLTGGGPGQSTYTIPITAFKYAFDSAIGHIGRACAAALSTVPVLIVIMLPILNNMLGDEEKLRRKAKRQQKREARSARRARKAVS